MDLSEKKGSGGNVINSINERVWGTECPSDSEERIASRWQTVDCAETLKLVQVTTGAASGFNRVILP